MRDGFVFYRSFADAIHMLPEDEQLGMMIAIINYALDDIEPKLLTNSQKIVFTLVKPQVDANKKRAEDGKKGGRPKKTIGFENENHRLENEKPKEKDKDKEKDKYKDNKRKNSFCNYPQSEQDMSELTKLVFIN